MTKKNARQIQDTIYSLAVALKRMAQGVLDFGTANATGESRAIARTLDPIVGNLDSEVTHD